MQYPQLLIFPVTRQLQSPQIIAYVALMVLVFRWLDAERTPNRLAAATAVLFVVVAVAYLLLMRFRDDAWTAITAPT